MFVFDIIQAVTNIGLIAGVIIAAIQLVLNRKIAKMDFDRRKKEATIAFTYEVFRACCRPSPVYYK